MILIWNIPTEGCAKFAAGIVFSRLEFSRGDFRKTLWEKGTGCNKKYARYEEGISTPHLLRNQKRRIFEILHGKNTELCGRIWIHFVKVDVSENWGTSKSSNFDRVFHYFHHPFWGFAPIFGNTQVDVEECPSFLVFRRAFVMHRALLGECFVCDTTMWRRKNLGFFWELKMVFGRVCFGGFKMVFFSISGRFVR